MEQQPQSYNPTERYVATAIHNILPPNYAHSISHERAPPYRFQRVCKRLQQKFKFPLRDLERMQFDNLTILGQRLARLASGMRPPQEEIKSLRQRLVA